MEENISCNEKDIQNDCSECNKCDNNIPCNKCTKQNNPTNNNINTNKVNYKEESVIISHPTHNLINFPVNDEIAKKRKLLDNRTNKRISNQISDSDTIDHPINLNIDHNRMNYVPNQMNFRNNQNLYDGKGNMNYPSSDIGNVNNQNYYNYVNNLTIYNINNYYILNNNDIRMIQNNNIENNNIANEEEEEYDFDDKKQRMNLEINKMKNEITLLKRQIGNFKRKNNNYSNDDEKANMYFQSYNKLFGNKAVPLDYLSHFSMKKEVSYGFMVFDKNLPNTGYNPSNIKILEISDVCALAYGYNPPNMLNKYLQTFSPHISQEELEEYSKDLLKVCKDKINYFKLIGFSKHQAGFLVCSECSVTVLCDENMKPHFVSTFLEKVYIVEGQKEEKYKTLFIPL